VVFLVLKAVCLKEASNGLFAITNGVDREKDRIYDGGKWAESERLRVKGREV
jgi:hypothetical protein